MSEPKFNLTDEEELEHAQNLAVKLIEENDALEACIKKLEEKLNEARTLLSTVDQAGGKKHHRIAVGVPQDDIEVSFLTASFMKKVKAWLNGSPTQEGDKE